MSERVKTIIIVSIISVLIWIYAEGESLTTHTTTITITLPTEPANANLTAGARIMWFEGGEGVSAMQVQITVEGSAIALDRLEDALQTPLDLSRSASFPAQKGDVQLLQLLRDHPRIRDRAVTVTTVDPPSARVEIDTLDSKQLDVEVRLPEGFQLTGPVRVSPDHVEVFYPRGAAVNAHTLTAVLPPEQVAPLAPGIPHPIEVALAAPPSLQSARFVRIDPPTVTATLTLQNTQDEHTIPSVYFWTLLPESETGKWNVDIQGPGFLRDVKVIGPAAQIARLKTEPPEIDIRAIIELSADDLNRGVTTATARFSPLPSTLRFEPAEVQVELVITQAAPGEGGQAEPPPP